MSSSPSRSSFSLSSSPLLIVLIIASSLIFFVIGFHWGQRESSSPSSILFVYQQHLPFIKSTTNNHDPGAIEEKMRHTPQTPIVMHKQPVHNDSLLSFSSLTTTIPPPPPSPAPTTTTPLPPSPSLSPPPWLWESLSVEGVLGCCPNDEQSCYEPILANGERSVGRDSLRYFANETLPLFDYDHPIAMESLAGGTISIRDDNFPCHVQSSKRASIWKEIEKQKNLYGTLSYCLEVTRRIASVNSAGNNDNDGNKCSYQGTPSSPILYHIFWSTDHPEHDQLLLVIQSVLVTQRQSSSRLMLWLTAQPSDRSLNNSIILKRYPTLIKWSNLLSNRFEIIVLKDFITQLNAPSYLHDFLRSHGGYDGGLHWTDSDIFRLLVLYEHGGVYLDADVVLLRDFGPLMDTQFLYQWGSHCVSSNGAIASFFKKSKHLELLLNHLPKMKGGGTTYGRDLYRYLDQWDGNPYNNQLSSLSQQYLRYPCCFFNSFWMGSNEAFRPNNFAAQWYGPFAQHIHGRVWKASVEKGSDYDKFRNRIRQQWKKIVNDDSD